MNELPSQGEDPDEIFILEDSDHGGIIMEIEQVLVHPDFNPFTYEHDIALIKLKERIRPSRDLFPVCLPPPLRTGQDLTDYSGEEVAITGWGCRAEHCAAHESPRYLQEVVMDVIPNVLAMCW